MSTEVVREEGATLLGKCKAWNLEKGYGFATCDDGGPDLFLHQSAINVEDGFRSISVGTAIQLTYTLRDGKPAGTNVSSPGGAALPGYSTRLEASQKMTVAPLLDARAGSMSGKCKWFDATKGYGFLTSDAGAEYFVNIKDVENQIPLAKEEPVDFFLENQADGRERAMKVRSLQPQQPQQQMPQPMFAQPPVGFAPPALLAPTNYGYPPTAYAPYQVQQVQQVQQPVMNMPGAVYQGMCKWFNPAKGFGFITPADGSSELYFKGQDVQGGAALEQGEPVRYEAKHQEGKSWAVNVLSTRITPKRAAPMSYETDPYAAAPMKQPKTQYAPAPAQRYEQQPPQPFAFDQYQQAVPKMATYGVPAQRVYEYETDPAAAYQQGVPYRQY